MDRLLDQARTGPFYLCRPVLAEMVAAAIRYGTETLSQYELHAYAVMPNHIHLLITPTILPFRLTQSLKSVTARRANEVLGLTGRPFWGEESYDHMVRNQREFEKIRAYIEQNPVRAGLVAAAEAYPWSSAAPGDLGIASGPRVRPTVGPPSGAPGRT
ncbi:transposase [uncultured Paludibaculum sp.]|uniref:transposase n=1 Tax=uncultured Paludibaculum sp. TaxID=1765020 RepID=UPI002AAB452E|nr:transposase [uncultured Paludibaculum sp.]